MDLDTISTTNNTTPFNEEALNNKDTKPTEVDTTSTAVVASRSTLITESATEKCDIPPMEAISDDHSNSNNNQPTPNEQTSLPNTTILTTTAAAGSDNNSNKKDQNGGIVVAMKRCVGRSNRGVTWGEVSKQGLRKTMEDTCGIYPEFMTLSCIEVGGCTAPSCRYASAKSPVHYFGVFDGHGGSEIHRRRCLCVKFRHYKDRGIGPALWRWRAILGSKLSSETANIYEFHVVKEKLQVSSHCANELHIKLAEEWGKGSGIDDWRRRWEVALCRAYERVDDGLKDKTLASAGSTASVVILSACQIIAANCGDSRVVLCRGKQSIPLTVDHKLNREDEVARIADEGGRIVEWGHCLRVEGVLSMTRAIGDHSLKPYIIPVPEITFTTRSAGDEFLVLASDGLWDVLSNDDVVNLARKKLRERRRQPKSDDHSSCPASYVAEGLFKCALGAYSQDNISIIVVDLKFPRIYGPAKAMKNGSLSFSHSLGSKIDL
ncbi:hypothetical protein JRO89_XS09G0185200 [Xanthoceras sorbifolium]|uniref:protein-serine/threonine phosphatase n=1 Tax=Xanthoceras sorbifolium TaxID=99658 RepID=A0ABQ8HLT1_9ROSI|nr:hypothetical protein JRO89_XS09G0185200 [Xanthoceras sorbifolium]